MKKSLFNEIEMRCCHIEAQSSSFMTVWQSILFGLHVFLLFNNPMGVGTIVYCYMNAIVITLQVLTRTLKRSDNQKGKYSIPQGIFCFVNFVATLLLIPVSLKLKYFELDADLGLKFLQINCILSAIYYTLVLIAFIILLKGYYGRSKTGIRDAILIIYETARMEKWLKTHYPQTTQTYDDSMDEELGDISSNENSSDNSDCSICLDTFESKAPVCRLKCKHYFHLSCIYQWLQHQNSRKVCPLCKEVNQLEQV